MGWVLFLVVFVGFKEKHFGYFWLIIMGWFLVSGVKLVQVGSLAVGFSDLICLGEFLQPFKELRDVLYEPCCCQPSSVQFIQQNQDVCITILYINRIFSCLMIKKSCLHPKECTLYSLIGPTFIFSSGRIFSIFLFNPIFCRCYNQPKFPQLLQSLNCLNQPNISNCY